jgi:hypothetical protein
VANAADKVGWKLIGGVTTAVAAAVARKALEGAYKGATGNEPPEKPENPEVAFGEAVLWAVASAVSIALIRLVVERAAAGAWVKARGELPPPLQKEE